MRADVSERTVRAAETGKRIKVDSLEMLAEALAVDVVHLADDPAQFALACGLQSRASRVITAIETYARETDIEPFLDLSRPDIVVDICLPGSFPVSGLHVGFEGVRRLRDRVAAIAEDLESIRFVTTGSKASGDLLVVDGNALIQCRAGSRPIAVRESLILQFDRDRIVRANHWIDAQALASCMPLE